MIIGADLIDGGGIVSRHDIQPMRRRRAEHAAAWAMAMEFSQLSFGVCKESGVILRINHHINLVGLQNAIGRALGVVTAAVVVEHRNLFGRAFAKAHADCRVWASLSLLLLQRFDRCKLRNVNAFFFAHDDVVPAAIHRRSWLNADKAIAAGRDWDAA